MGDVVEMWWRCGGDEVYGTWVTLWTSTVTFLGPRSHLWDEKASFGVEMVSFGVEKVCFRLKNYFFEMLGMWWRCGGDVGG